MIPTGPYSSHPMTCGHSWGYIDKLGEAGFYRKDGGPRLCRACSIPVMEHAGPTPREETVDTPYPHIAPPAPRGVIQTLAELRKREVILEETIELECELQVRRYREYKAVQEAILALAIYE